LDAVIPLSYRDKMHNTPPKPKGLGSQGTTTRRQHHVWRSYLDAWATDSKIWCLQNGRAFETNVINVAVERDFYKLHDLTDADIFLIRSLMKEISPPAKQVLENFILMFGQLGRFRTLPLVANNTELLALIDRELITMEEKFHAQLEGNIKPIFDAILRKDLSFYDDPDLCGQFCHFLSLQNLRTKGVQHRVLAKTVEQQGMSLERAWNVLRHIMAANAGGSLMLERKTRPLILLENETDVPFITGDQPVINLLSPGSDEPPRLLAFYYPVSPRIAVLLDEVNERTRFAAGPVSANQVIALNRRIQAAAHRQIYGSSRDVLDSLSQIS
jgi:hypothetical protein